MYAAVAILGCGPAQPLFGTVARKIHKPAWTETIAIYDNEMNFNGFRTVQHPPQWLVVVQEDGTANDEGQRLVTVAESSYGKLEVGGIWMQEGTILEAPTTPVKEN